MESTLYLVRHAETDWNTAGRYQGQSDPPLSARGEMQAQHLASSLASIHVSAVLTSPLQRARKTALALAERVGLAAVSDDRLMELGFGKWEGLTQAEVKSRWPELLRMWKKAPDQTGFPGGETLHDLRCRVQSFLSDMAQQPGPVLAVTHEAVIRVAILELRGEPLSEYRRVQVANASVTPIVLRANGLHQCH